MNTSRGLVYLLSSALEDSEEKKESIIEKSKQQWLRMSVDQSVITRIFNPFQHLDLIDADFFQQSSREFMNLLDIENAYRTSSRVLLKDDKAVNRWATSVVKYACDNLLEKSGLLNRQIITCLDWQECGKQYIYKPRFIFHIVCSLVGTFFQQLTMNKNTFPFMQTDIYIALTIFINRNYRSWVRKEMRENYGYEEKFVTSTVRKNTGTIHFERKTMPVIPVGAIEIEMSPMRLLHLEEGKEHKALEESKPEQKPLEEKTMLVPFTDRLEEEGVLVDKNIPTETYLVFNFSFFSILAQRVKENLAYYGENVLWRISLGG